MPDTRKHRGPHPEDRRLFADAALADLRAAVGDLSLLRTRGYSETASLKLVGDRFALDRRQRVAVMRAACSDQALAARTERLLAPDDLRGHPLRIDGYNLLITIEAALADGAVLHCRDGTFRDMASMHGTYRKVRETVPAIEMIGRWIAALAPSECLWYLDRSVSNSGRLKTILLEVAEALLQPTLLLSGRAALLLLQALQLDPREEHDFEIPEFPQSYTSEPEPQLDVILDRAFQLRSDLRAFEARVDAAEKGERVAAAGLWPRGTPRQRRNRPDPMWRIPGRGTGVGRACGICRACRVAPGACPSPGSCLCE